MDYTNINNYFFENNWIFFRLEEKFVLVDNEENYISFVSESLFLKITEYISTNKLEDEKEITLSHLVKKSKNMTSRPTKFELRSDTYSEYNFLAEFYDKHWGDFYEGLYPLIKKHYDEFAFPDEKILDICCGTGQFIRKLWNEGYNVTGLDGSEEMINVAKVNNPNVEFLVKDIRDFNFPNEYKMITCLFDSINHITKNEELLIVFKNVYNSLTEGGKFIFDVNTYRNFNDYWNNEFEIIEDQYRISIKTKFPVKPDIASMNIKVLSLQNDTILKENTILERCYETSEIKQMLLKCGFKSVNSLEDNSGRYIFIADI